MEERPRTRRAALRTLTLAAAGVAGLWRFLTPRAGQAAARLLRVRSADVPAGGAVVLPDDGVAIVRTGGAVRALDLSCTHLGCKVGANQTGFACPCHGSRFDVRGERIAGPATAALRVLEARDEDGMVTVGAAASDSGEPT